MPSIPPRCKFRTQRPTTKQQSVHRRDSIAVAIRNSNRWKRVREIKMRMNPLCEDPLGLHGKELVAAAQIHHLQEIAAAPELAFTLENLQSVCVRCHAVLSAQERA